MHEYSVEPDDALDDVEKGFWRQFSLWTVIPGTQFSRTLWNMLVKFLQDCIRACPVQTLYIHALS